jgi:glycosyltransferase involved in cell wall biosynthesis
VNPLSDPAPAVATNGHGPADVAFHTLPDQARPDRTWPVAARDGSTIAVSVSVVVPARNEALNLPYVLSQLPSMVSEVVLVDGRSTDETVEIARSVRPDIRIIGQEGRGKGDALRCGFEAARGDIIVMIDADGSMSPREIDRYVDALCNGADLVKGSRRLEGGGSSDFTLSRELGNRALGALFNTLFDACHTDLCYGYMAFWRRMLPVLVPDCDGFEVETLMNIRAARGGLHVTEVPSIEARRLHGDSNLHTFRDGWRVLRTMATERVSGPRRRVVRSMVERGAGRSLEVEVAG